MSKTFMRSHALCAGDGHTSETGPHQLLGGLGKLLLPPNSQPCTSPMNCWWALGPARHLRRSGREKLWCVFSSLPHSTPNTDQHSILPSSVALYKPERMKPGNIIHLRLPCPGLMVCAVWAEHTAPRWPPKHQQILLVFPGGSLCLSQKMTHGWSVSWC